MPASKAIATELPKVAPGFAACAKPKKAEVKSRAPQVADDSGGEAKEKPAEKNFLDDSCEQSEDKSARKVLGGSPA